MRLTFVQSETDNSTAWRLDETWERLADFLTTHRRLPAKGDLGVIFARFVDGPCRRLARSGKCTASCPGNDHRIDENVEAVTALGLDFDDAPPDRLSALLTELQSRQLRYIGYTTWSSTPEAPKIRVVIALDAEVPAAQFRGFWDAVIDDLGIRDIVDTKCRNPGRLFFTPQCPPDGTPMSAAYEGAPLSVDHILARVPTQPVESVNGADDSGHNFPPASPALLSHAMTRLQQHGPAIEGRGGNAHTRAAWGILVNDLALSDVEAAAVFRVWDLSNRPPWGDAAFAGPARSDQAWSGPRGVERERFDHANVDVFGNAPAAPTHPSVLADEDTGTTNVPIRRYATGLPGLDAKLGGGISTRQATIVMAPPADGKSALAVSVSIFVQAVIPVLYASTELETHELRARIAAPRLGVAWRDIVDGKVDAARVAESLRGLRIHLLGCERLPMGETALQSIHDETVRITSLYGVAPMVVIDYLQDLARGVDERGVRSKIGGLATICRAMSQQLDCVMLVISSVSRSYYGMKRASELRQAEDATAYLAAAKESGDVDYAAAAVVFLDVVGAEQGAGFRCARLAVAKSRHGETGFVGARFAGATGAWIEAPDEVVEAAGKRAAAKAAGEGDQDDMVMLAAVVQAAGDGRYLTRNKWREKADRPSTLGESRAESAIDRLVAAGRLMKLEMHPRTGHGVNNGGTYIAPVGTRPYR